LENILIVPEPIKSLAPLFYVKNPTKKELFRLIGSQRDFMRTVGKRNAELMIITLLVLDTI